MATATKKSTTAERGLKEVSSGIRVGVDNARTRISMAERALAEAFAERDALLADALGDIARQMIRDAAAPIIEQRQHDLHAAEVQLGARQDSLRRAIEDAARSADPLHTKFADLMGDQVRQIIAPVSPRLGALVVVPADVTRQGHLYAGQATITATGADLNPYEWRATMSWALPALGDLRDDYGSHVGPDVTYLGDYTVALDRLVVIDRDAERQASERREQSMVLREALTRVGPGQAMQVQAAIEALYSEEDL